MLVYTLQFDHANCFTGFLYRERPQRWLIHSLIDGHLSNFLFCFCYFWLLVFWSTHVLSYLGFIPLSFAMKDFYYRDFPDGPVVRIRHFTAMALGSIHGQRTKIPQAVQCGQKNKLFKNYKKLKKKRERKGERVLTQRLRTQNWKHLLTGWVWKWGKESWMMPEFSAWAIKWNVMLLTERQNWLGANKYD